MPSIQGECTFTELCLKLDVSAPWIKKVQRLFRLPEAHGTKGVRRYYTQRQVQFLRNIRTLRAADVDFKEVLVLDELERWLLGHGGTIQHSGSDAKLCTFPLLLRGWESLKYSIPVRTMASSEQKAVEAVHGRQYPTIREIVPSETLDKLTEYYLIVGRLLERLSRRVQELATAEEDINRAKKRWAEWIGERS